MTPSVVVDASAGVEIAADTTVGRALLSLLTAGARLHVPEHFYAECGAVLRKWGNGRLLPDARLAIAVDHLARLPLLRAQVKELVPPAWRRRHNFTFADALYVALAERLGAPLLTGDHKLAAAPTLRVPVLHISAPGQWPV